MTAPDAAVWDVFISHASEDKGRVARPLAEALTSLGLQVWYDETTLRVGNSLRREIDRGLASASYGVVVLSPSFFRKSWPQKELDGLVSREELGVEIILPVWYKVSQSDIRRHSPTLADKLGIQYTGDALGAAAQIALRVYHGRRATRGQDVRGKMDAIREALKNGDARFLADSINALGDRFTWHTAPTLLIDALIELLSHGSDVTKATALQVCAEQLLPGFAHIALSKHLRHLLHDEDPSFSALAAKALARMDDKHSLDDLRDLAVNGRTVAVRVEAAAALVRLQAASGKEITLTLVRDGSDETRLVLIERLEDIPGSVGLEVAEQLALDQKVSFQVRTAAAVKIAAETVNTFDESQRKRFSEMLRRILKSMTPEEQGLLLEKVIEWSQYSIDEFGVGYELAMTLIEFSSALGVSPGRVVAACMVLTEDDRSEEALVARSRAWELLSCLPTEEVEACGYFLSHYLFHWSPIWSSEIGKVVALLAKHPRLKNWIPFAWNIEGDEMAEVALRNWNREKPYEVLHYFRRHPHMLAVDELRRVAEQPPGYDSLMAKFSLLQLDQVRVRPVLEDCLQHTGWVVADTLQWIDMEVARGQLKLKPDERELLELIRLRQAPDSG
jgi:hypothetical protein